MNKDDARVVHLVHWTRSGITTLVKGICASKGHSLILLERDNEFDAYYADVHDRYCAKGSILRFVKILRSISPDIIQAHSFMPLLVALLFSKRSKVIFHVHNEYPYFYDRKIRSVVKRLILQLAYLVAPYQVICVSKESGESIKDIIGADYSVVVNGIQDEGSIRSFFDDGPDQYRFYSVCRLDDQKNLRYAISLIKDLSERLDFKTVTYDIYGKGALYEVLSQMIERQSLSGFVNMKGFIHDPQILPEFYDYYISPSLYEGFGLSIVSAMRGRNIVFMTPVGDLPRYLDDGDDVIFLDLERSRDVEVISEFLLAENENKVTIQRNARQKFLSHFTQDKMFEQLDRYYRL